MSRTYIALIAAALMIFAGCAANEGTPTAPITILSPDGVTAASQNTSSIQLNWNDNSNNEDGFRIERSPYGSNSWSVVGAVGQNLEAYLDTGLTEGTVYAYYVRAVLGASGSASSDTVRAGTKLVKPTNGVATGETVVLVSLSWEDNTNAETGYRVERKTGAGRFIQLASLPANSTALRDSNLIANTTYTYHVRAIKDSLTSEWSDDFIGHTLDFPPNAPIQLRASVVEVTSVQLTWRDNSDNEEGFRIEKALIGQNDWQVIGSQATTGFTDTGLPEGTGFQYRVCAYIGSSISNYVGPVSISTSIHEPSGLTATRDSETSISISWQDGSEAEGGYQISRRLGLNPYLTLGVTLGAGSETYLDTGLDRDMTYTYRVRAVKDTLASVWSNEASAHTTLRTPNPPTGLTAQGDFAWINEAHLSWTDNSSGERNERGFVLQKSPNGVDTWTLVDSTEADIVIATVANLESESTWFFRVSTYNEYGISEFSNVASCVIAGLPPAPTNLSAEGGAITPGGAILRWSDNSASETAFIVELSADGQSGWARHDSLAANTIQFLIRNLPVETTQYFRVLSRNSAGRSAYTNVASANIIGIPPSPTTLVANAPDYRAAVLQWQDHSQSETGFHVERRDADNFYWRLVRSVGAGIVQFADSTVTAERAYVYRVRSYNDAGMSDATNEARVDIPPSPPTTPTDLTVSALYIDKISVGWYDRALNEDGYFVERMAYGENEFTLVGAFEANTNYMIDSSCAPNSWYTYRVYCTNDAGASALTDTAGALTWPLEFFTETFEGHDVEAPPGQPWTTVAAGGSAVLITNESQHGGEKSLHFSDPDSGFSRAYSFGDAGQISQGVLTAWLYVPRGTNFDFFGANAGTYFTFQVTFASNDSIMVWNGATQEQWGAYPTDEWFKLDITFNEDEATYQVSINDEVACDPSAPRAAGQQLVGAIAWEALAWQNFFIDDISIVRLWEPDRMVRTNRRPTRIINSVGSPASLNEMFRLQTGTHQPQ